MLTRLHCLRIAPFLWEYAAGNTPADQAERVEGHVIGCSRCAQQLKNHRATLLHLNAYDEGLPLVSSDWPALRPQVEISLAPGSRRLPSRWVACAAGAAIAGVFALILMGLARPRHGDGTLPSTPGGKSQPAGDAETRAATAEVAGRSAANLPLTGNTNRRDAGPTPARFRGVRPAVATGFQPVARPGPKHPRSAPDPIADAEYLNGAAPGLTARWMTGNDHDRQALEWLKRRLPPVKDDFVEIPFPLLASADPRSGAVSDAVKKYEADAQVVDTRLFRKVTLRLKADSLGNLCGEVAKQTGVRIDASRAIADENVTALLEDRPAREVMREVARLFGYKWRRSGEDEKYRYELYQDLRSQLAEEEMRNRDLHEALIALDQDMAKYQPLLNLAPEQAKTRAEHAEGGEKSTLNAISGKGWGAAQLYFRLSPAQQLALAAGQTLTFSSNSPSPELRLPEDLRRSVLVSTGETVGTFEGSPAIVETGFGEPGTPLADRTDATAEVTLSMERSELGQLTLHGHSGGGLEDETGMKKMFWAGDSTLSSAASPSVAKPDNARANAGLANLPEFKKVASIKPRPSCPWFSPDGKPEDRAGFELENNGRLLSIGPSGQFEVGLKPHVTTADTWEAVHQATGLPIVADSYLRVYDADPLRAEKTPLFVGLCRVGDAMGVRWQKDGDFLLARSTSYFWDKLKEVPVGLLRRWQADRKKGILPLNDLLEMSTLSEPQLDSKIVGYVIGHCWDLEEWGIVGSGGAFRIGLPGGAYMRKYARFLASLSPGQREQARRSGLLLGDLPPPQRDSLAQMVLQEKGDPQALIGLRFRVDYAPVGTYIWHPVVETTTEAEAMNAKWPFVAAETAGAALSLARKYNGAAKPEEVQRSRGALVLSFQNARRDTWHTGGPGVAFSLNH